MKIHSTGKTSFICSQCIVNYYGKKSLNSGNLAQEWIHFREAAINTSSAVEFTLYFLNRFLR